MWVSTEWVFLGAKRLKYKAKQHLNAWVLLAGRIFSNIFQFMIRQKMEFLKPINSWIDNEEIMTTEYSSEWCKIIGRNIYKFANRFLIDFLLQISDSINLCNNCSTRSLSWYSRDREEWKKIDWKNNRHHHEVIIKWKDFFSTIPSRWSCDLQFPSRSENGFLIKMHIFWILSALSRLAVGLAIGHFSSIIVVVECLCSTLTRRRRRHWSRQITIIIIVISTGWATNRFNVLLPQALIR